MFVGAHRGVYRGIWGGYMGIYRGHGGSYGRHRGACNRAIVTTGISVGAMGEGLLWRDLYGHYGAQDPYGTARSSSGYLWGP